MTRLRRLRIAQIHFHLRPRIQEQVSPKTTQFGAFWLILRISSRLRSQRVTHKKNQVILKKTGCRITVHLKKRRLTRRIKRCMMSMKKQKHF